MTPVLEDLCLCQYLCPIERVTHHKWSIMSKHMFIVTNIIPVNQVVKDKGINYRMIICVSDWNKQSCDFKLVHQRPSSEIVIHSHWFCFCLSWGKTQVRKLCRKKSDDPTHRRSNILIHVSCSQSLMITLNPQMVTIRQWFELLITFTHATVWVSLLNTCTCLSIFKYILNELLFTFT